jgi:para-nitrobenzyl esterase
MNLHWVRMSAKVGPRSRQAARGLVLSAVLAALTCGAPAAFAARAIVTDQGPLKGLALAGEHEYLGIPYAAPPVGNLRWLPPSHRRASEGCFRPRNSAISARSFKTVSALEVGSEDCLYLNVYVPDTDPPAHGFDGLDSWRLSHNWCRFRVRSYAHRR